MKGQGTQYLLLAQIPPFYACLCLDIVLMKQTKFFTLDIYSAPTCKDNKHW